MELNRKNQQLKRETIIGIEKVPEQQLHKILKDSQGEQGEQGRPGPKGLEGEQGDQGYRGHQGASGLNSNLNGKDGEFLLVKDYSYGSSIYEMTLIDKERIILASENTIIRATVEQEETTVPFVCSIFASGNGVSLEIPGTISDTHRTYIIEEGHKVIVCFIPDRDKWYVMEV